MSKIRRKKNRAVNAKRGIFCQQTKQAKAEIVDVLSKQAESWYNYCLVSTETCQET